jgi:hypothetical protein
MINPPPLPAMPLKILDKSATKNVAIYINSTEILSIFRLCMKRVAPDVAACH